MITISFKRTEGLNRIEPFIKALSEELNANYPIGFYHMPGKRKIVLTNIEQTGDKITFGTYDCPKSAVDKSWNRFLDVLKRFEMELVVDKKVIGESADIDKSNIRTEER